MTQHPKNGWQVAVVVWHLLRKSIQDVVTHVNAELMAPFQELNILNGRHAFAHQLQEARVEALDAGLDTHDTSLGHELQLVPSQVRLHRIKDAEV